MMMTDKLSISQQLACWRDDDDWQAYPFHNSYLADVMMTDKTIHFTIDNKRSIITDKLSCRLKSK
jgi:hypothetical protein